MNVFKRGLIFSTTLAAVFCLTACDDSTPYGVVSSAAYAVKRNDLKGFQKTLTPEAQAKFGDQAAFDRLQQLLAPYSKKLKIASVQLLHAERGDQGYGHTGDVVRYFSVAINSGKHTPVIMSAETVCAVWWHQGSDSIGGIDDCNHSPGVGEVCEPWMDRSGEVQNCRIADLAFSLE